MIELLINLFPSLAEKFASYFGKIIFNVSKAEMKLDKPKEPDGEGGFNHGSYGNFTLEIINKKASSKISAAYVKNGSFSKSFTSFFFISYPFPRLPPA